MHLLGSIRRLQTLPLLWLRVKYNYFSICRRPSEIILFQRVETYPKLETISKLFQRISLLQLLNIFQRAQCL